MPERLDQLVADSLGDLVPVDVPALSRRARRRRRARRGALVGGVSLIVVLLAAAVVLPRQDDESQQVVTRPDPSDAFVLEGDPVGSWTEAAPPPFGPRSQAFSTELDDGRILVWGGIDAATAPDGIPPLLPDGAIYDPATDTWEAIPPIPLPDGEFITGPSGVAFYSEQVEENRLAVVGRSRGDVLNTAVYDIDRGTWTVAPAQTDLGGYLDAIAWDGTTVALVRTDPGPTDAPFDVPGPFTRRWSPGDDAWSEGTPPPLSARTLLGTSSADGLLALFGGTTSRQGPEGPTPGPDASDVRDGAIYDIGNDAWSAIPPPPVETGVSGGIVRWQDGELFVGGGTDSFELSEATVFSTPALFDPDAGTWRTVAATPRIRHDLGDGEGPQEVAAGPGRMPQYLGFSRGGDQFVVAQDQFGSTGIHPWYLIDETWEQSPLFNLVGDNDLVVASGDPEGDIGVTDHSYGDVAVRQAPGHWRPGTPAPVDDPWATAFVSNGRLVVLTVAGFESVSDEAPHRTLVFDPEG